MATGPVDEGVPPPTRQCRFCGEDGRRSDEVGPVHPCCAIHAVERPGGAVAGVRGVQEGPPPPMT